MPIRCHGNNADNIAAILNPQLRDQRVMVAIATEPLKASVAIGNEKVNIDKNCFAPHPVFSLQSFFFRCRNERSHAALTSWPSRFVIARPVVTSLTFTRATKTCFFQSLKRESRSKKWKLMDTSFNRWRQLAVFSLPTPIILNRPPRLRCMLEYAGGRTTKKQEQRGQLSVFVTDVFVTWLNQTKR